MEGTGPWMIFYPYCIRHFFLIVRLLHVLLWDGCKSLITNLSTNIRNFLLRFSSNCYSWNLKKNFLILMEEFVLSKFYSHLAIARDITCYSHIKIAFIRGVFRTQVSQNCALCHLWSVHFTSSYQNKMGYRVERCKTEEHRSWFEKYLWQIEWAYTIEHAFCFFV